MKTTIPRQCCRCRQEGISSRRAGRSPSARGRDFCEESPEPSTGKPTRLDPSETYPQRKPTFADAEEVSAIRYGTAARGDRFEYERVLPWRCVDVPADWNTSPTR